MNLEELIRTRRTLKAFDPTPVDRDTLDGLIDLARWAPNHNLTNPWRFRVIGPRTLDALKQAAGPEQAPKLDRAPTLVVASAVVDPDDPVQTAEDLAAAAVATYIVLLGAHARGLGGYWRTPAVLRTREGRAAVGITQDPSRERVLGLLYLGSPKAGDKPVPARADLETIRSYLD